MVNRWSPEGEGLGFKMGQNQPGTFTEQDILEQLPGTRDHLCGADLITLDQCAAGAGWLAA